MKNFYVHNRQEANPEISENGSAWQTVSPEELENWLKQIKTHRAAGIIYSREDPSGNLSDCAQKNFNLIEAARLPIRLVKRKGSDGSGETEQNGEASYANCLLVTIAKSKGSIAVLESGKTVPDLEHLTSNSSELLWIRGLPFNYAQLKADFVIHIILGAAREFLGINRLLGARMVLSGGKSEMVRFLIKQTGKRIEITRID